MIFIRRNIGQTHCISTCLGYTWGYVWSRSVVQPELVHRRHPVAQFPEKRSVSARSASDERDAADAARTAAA